MTERELARQRERRTQNAINVLKKHAKHAQAALQMMERAEQFIASRRDNLPTRATDARMEYALGLLDIQAEAYLIVVDNQEHHDAFVVLLTEWGFRSWEEYTDSPLYAVPPVGPKFEVIRARVRHWTKEGFRRMIATPNTTAYNPNDFERTMETGFEALARATEVAAQVEALGSSSESDDSGSVSDEAMEAQTVRPVSPNDVRRQQFPARAKWLNERLKERGWDWNEPYRWSGPDRKTVQKILAEKFVRPDILRKLVLALNHLKIGGKTISVSDIPSD